MKTIINISGLLAILSLIVILAVSVLFASGRIPFDSYLLSLFVGTIVYFAGKILISLLRNNKNIIDKKA